jgi:hypothetical protein
MVRGRERRLRKPGERQVWLSEDRWLVAMDGGYRGTLAQRDAVTLGRVRDGNLRLRSRCDAMATNVL